MKLKDREALRQWEEYRKGIIQSTSIDLTETYAEKDKRIKFLLSDFEEFCKYYFPKYFQSDFAAFHKRFAKKVINNQRIYITRAWSRAHAKSVLSGIMLPLYLKFTGDLKNMLVASYNETNAETLLRPLMIQLEVNQRLINDFGIQKGFGNWADGKFITKDGCSFRAIGSGQNPRGTREEEARPDYILWDDLDDEEVCRNPKRLDEVWEWLQGALLGCFDITGKGRFIGVGNIIAQDSLMVRASKVSDDHEQIDIFYTDKAFYQSPEGKKLIRDLNTQLKECKDEKKIDVINDAIGYAKANLRPSWNRFSLMECAYMINKMTSRLAQREYFNNPLIEGKVYKKEWMQSKQMPPLSSYNFLVNYLDPGFKKTKSSDTKAMWLIGLKDGEFHIRKGYCAQASVEEMVDWGYEIDDFVRRNNAAYEFFMEEVFLQSLLYKDFEIAAKKRNRPLPVTGDTRKKPDKDARIEANSGFFERGAVYFDEAIMEDHHTKALIGQFLVFQPGVKTKKDGPDCIEGGFFKLLAMVRNNTDFTVGKRYANEKRA